MSSSGWKCKVVHSKEAYPYTKEKHEQSWLQSYEHSCNEQNTPIHSKVHGHA